MKLVKWYDDDGFLRQSYIRDTDVEEDARELGVRHEPPDFSVIDWKEVERELNNTFIERGIITWNDVQKNQDAFMSTITIAMKRRLIALYRQKL